MVNPINKSIKELTMSQWIWKTAKYEMMAVLAIGLIFFIGILINYGFWWALLPLIWYTYYLTSKVKLYKKNVVLYDNWEELYGPTIEKKNRNK